MNTDCSFALSCCLFLLRNERERERERERDLPVLRHDKTEVKNAAEPRRRRRRTGRVRFFEVNITRRYFSRLMASAAH